MLSLKAALLDLWFLIFCILLRCLWDQGSGPGKQGFSKNCQPRNDLLYKMYLGYWFRTKLVESNFLLLFCLQFIFILFLFRFGVCAKTKAFLLVLLIVMKTITKEAHWPKAGHWQALDFIASSNIQGETSSSWFSMLFLFCLSHASLSEISFPHTAFFDLASTPSKDFLLPAEKAF